MIRRYLACLAACLLPLVTSAQVGVIDHNWSFNTAGYGRYGVQQVTFPSSGSYTFILCGTKSYHVHAKAAPLATTALVPLAATILLLTRFAGSTRKAREPQE